MKVTVVGSGSWGTAIAVLLGSEGHHVTLWTRRAEIAAAVEAERRNPERLPDLEVPTTVHALSNLSAAVAGADAIVIATPSTAVRSICEDMKPYVPIDVPIVVLSKGVERETEMLLTETVTHVLRNADRVAILSGPNHAEEVALQMPSAAVVASYDEETARFFQELFHVDTFRVYTSSDVTGVAICGAAKNIMAITVGIASGHGFGDNTAALIMTRGLAEMSRLVAALGGDPLTCMGLAGMGDLIATCTSEHSRNRSFGVEFAHGVSLEDYIERENVVVEGAVAVRSIRELAKQHEVEMPIADALHELLYEEASFASVVEKLYDRAPDIEFYGIGKDA